MEEGDFYLQYKDAKKKGNSEVHFLVSYNFFIVSY